MKNKTFLFITAFALIFASCSKEEQSESTIAIPTGTGGGTSEPTTFVFTGSMAVDKNDSNWVDISNYIIPGTESRVFKATSNYIVSTNFDATSLKGEVIHSIPVDIPNNYFSGFADGVGIFTIGIIDGYYGNDSLYYHVLYQDADSNNIYLDFTGKLTNSF